jgi:hypothetical protein
MELVAELWSDSGLEQSVRLLGRRLRRDETESPCDPVHVRVDGKCVASHREEQHAGSSLGPDPGKRDEIALDLSVVELVEPAEVDLALPLFDFIEDALDTDGLGVRKPTRANGVCHLRRIRVPDRAPVGEAALEAAEGARGVQVRGVLAQYGHQELVHDGESLLTRERTLLAQQPAMERARPASIDLWGQRGTFASDANFVY